MTVVAARQVLIAINSYETKDFQKIELRTTEP